MAQPDTPDDVFQALPGSTRRKVLERLSQGPATASETAQPFDMKLPSFVQHLSVLEKSRFVKSKKTGRVRTFEIAPQHEFATFTAVITLESAGAGTKHVAHVMHAGESCCIRHEEMGFHVGWGVALKQLVVHVKKFQQP